MNILLAVEYVSRWVEVIPTQKANSKTVIKFVKKHIFCRFGTPRVLINNDGAHLQCAIEEGIGALWSQAQNSHNLPYSK